MVIFHSYVSLPEGSTGISCDLAAFSKGKYEKYIWEG